MALNHDGSLFSLSVSEILSLPFSEINWMHASIIHLVSAHWFDMDACSLCECVYLFGLYRFHYYLLWLKSSRHILAIILWPNCCNNKIERSLCTAAPFVIIMHSPIWVMIWQRMKNDTEDLLMHRNWYPCIANNSSWLANYQTKSIWKRWNENDENKTEKIGMLLPMFVKVNVRWFGMKWLRTVMAHADTRR